MLTKVLYHVVTLELTVNENVKTNLFLELDALCDLVLVEVYILLLGDVALSEILTVLSYVSSLREGTDSCCREQGKIESCLLDLLAFSKLGKSCVVGILDVLYSLLNLRVVSVYAALVKLLVSLEHSLVLVYCKGSNLNEFRQLLLGKSEMLLILICKLRLACECVRNMKEGAGCVDHDVTCDSLDLIYDVKCLLVVVLPDVLTILGDNFLILVGTYIVEEVVVLQHLGMAIAAAPE